MKRIAVAAFFMLAILGGVSLLGSCVRTVPKIYNPGISPTPTMTPTMHGVQSGAFCSNHEQYGYTASGTLMQCKTGPTDSRYRWRTV